MHNLIEFINKEHNNKYKYLKLSTVNYNKIHNILNLIILYPDEIGFISQECKQEIFACVKEFVDLNIKIEIKYIKSFYDNEYLKKVSKEFITLNYPSMLAVIKTDKLSFVEQEKLVQVSLNYLNNYISLKQLNKFKASLESHLNNQFSYKFEIILTGIDANINNNLLENKKKEILDNMTIQEVKQKRLKVEVLDQLIGTETSPKPLCVSSILGPELAVNIVGTIKYLNEREFTKKQKVLDGEEGQTVDVKKTFYSFVIESAGKQLNAVYFPNKNTIEKAKLLENGMEVVLTGDVEEYNGRLSVKIKHITKVKILEKPKETIDFKPVPKNYISTFPEPFEAIGQASLFEVEKEPVDYLKKNTFVVFDLETTGLNHEDCKIVEIGAVKIENGKITEKFSTFVDPEIEIPLDSTKIHGITDAMVMGAPKVDVAIADFYKFCEDSTIVAYNIAFDYKFINYNARKYGYNFNHPQQDALIMARKYIKGLKNYKLKTVTESLGVVLSNAHRAYYDAAATAKVFIKLAENM